MTSEGSVQIKDLRKEYDDIVAVDGVSLDIKDGEFLTILGPSGCGKSTTLRCIAGLETPTSGKVNINGEEMTDNPANKRPTSIVFQEWALFPHMTVGENISFGLEMDGVPKSERKERVAEALKLVELSGYEDRQASELSGGQKQRVAMARSIVCEPDVLLLDEPLASLDRALRQRMQVELKNLQEQLGITFIYVTHDQEEALTMSDRIAVMNEGQIAQVGSATEIYEHPATKFVAEFLGETNLFEGTSSVENGQIVITADELTIKVTKPTAETAVTDGGTVAFTVRPEHLSLSSNGDLACENTWAGRVENVIYKGSNTLYEIDIGNRLLKVEQQRGQDVPLFDEGNTVTVGFNPDDGEIIPPSK